MDIKATLNEQFARISKALSNPKRLELLHILGQGERTVESLARATGLGVTTASAHLQALRQARLVDGRRDGVRVYYRLADDAVYRLLIALQEVGRIRLAEVQQVERDYFRARDGMEAIPRRELQRRIERGDVIVIDVRPRDEYRAGHVPHAVSIPLDDLAEHLRALPPGREVVAYCRGPYCVLATEAVEVLRKAGRQARRMEGGLPEWKLDALPVAVGDA